MKLTKAQRDLVSVATNVVSGLDDCEVVKTDFGRGMAMTLGDAVVPLWKPAWAGFRVLKRGPRKGEAIPTGRSGAPYTASPQDVRDAAYAYEQARG